MEGDKRPNSVRLGRTGYVYRLVLGLLFRPLAVGLVRLPVGQLARLPTVPHLLAPRALHEPRTAAARVGAVHLGLQIRHLLDRGVKMGCDVQHGSQHGSTHAVRTAHHYLSIGPCLHEPLDDFVLFARRSDWLD